MCAAKQSRTFTEYLLPNTRPAAGARLTLLSAIFDPASEAALARTGVGPGWRCWEVGAGEGSLARWLSARVGREGSVLATDLDPILTDRQPGLEVRRHDVVHQAPPDDRFDLVHTRLLLCHLTEREAVFDRLIGALKPGGWLVVEDFDRVSMPPDNQCGPRKRRWPRMQGFKRCSRSVASRAGPDAGCLP